MNTQALAELHDDAFGEAMEDRQQYLTFRIGSESFAIGILFIKEIIEFNDLTAVPMMPACVRGVINLRGRVVPAIDLSLRFGRTETVPGRRTCIVIIEAETGEGSMDVGVIVDAVNQVIEIPAEDIEPAPGMGMKMRPEFIAGMGKIDGQFVIILDVAKVLSAADLNAIRPTEQ